MGNVRLSVVLFLLNGLLITLTTGCAPNVRPIYDSEAGQQILVRIDTLEKAGLEANANSRKLDRQRIETEFDIGLAKAGATVPAVFAKKWAIERARALIETKTYHDTLAWQIKTNAAQARGLKLKQDAAILKTIDLSRIRGEDLFKILLTAARLAAKAYGAP